MKVSQVLLTHVEDKISRCQKELITKEIVRIYKKNIVTNRVYRDETFRLFQFIITIEM